MSCVLHAREGGGEARAGLVRLAAAAYVTAMFCPRIRTLYFMSDYPYETNRGRGVRTAPPPMATSPSLAAAPEQTRSAPGRLSPQACPRTVWTPAWAPGLLLKNVPWYHQN